MANHDYKILIVDDRDRHQAVLRQKLSKKAISVKRQAVRMKHWKN